MQVYYRVGTQRNFRKAWTMIDTPMAMVVQAPEVVKLRYQLAKENAVPVRNIDVVIADSNNCVCFVSSQESITKMKQFPHYWDTLTKRLSGSGLRLRDIAEFNDDGFDYPTYLQGWGDMPESMLKNYVSVNDVLARLAA